MKKSVISLATVLSVVAAALILITACSKDNSNGGTTNNGQASVAVTNASGTSTLYSVYSDSTSLNSNAQIGYGSTTGSLGNPYSTVAAGTHRIRLSSNNGSSYVLDTSINFVANQRYSVFGYDTSATTGGPIKALILSDNISTAPASGQAAVRFIPLSPNTTATSIWLVNGTDSVAINNLNYVGLGSYNNDSLSSFKTVNAGTYHILINNAENLNLLAADSVTLSSGKFYTLYSKGYSGLNTSDSLTVGVIQQN